MKFQKNILLTGAAGKPIGTDIFLPANESRSPVVIYAHGFNGFKDWGNFDLIAQQFADAGFAFVKFNFSHNGTTPEAPEEFADLNAFGENNYTKELFDLQVVIDWTLSKENPFATKVDPERLFLIGHSRGGGIVILKAAAEPRVKAIATWASVSECKTPWGSWSAEKMAEWKQTGVQYYLNGRTQQQMPLYYQLFEDYQQHADTLNVISSISGLSIPILICHGTADPAVPVEKAHQLHAANPASELYLLDSDHVFGRKHPWTSLELPAAMQAVADRTIAFFQSH